MTHITPRPYLLANDEGKGEEEGIVAMGRFLSLPAALKEGKGKGKKKERRPRRGKGICLHDVSGPMEKKKRGKREEGIGDKGIY